MKSRTPSLAAAALAATLLLPATAHAADYCITAGSTFVLKNFKMPKAGKCVALNGFGVFSTESMLTGSACAAANGTFVRFVMVLLGDFANSDTVIRYVHLNLPAQTGTHRTLGLTQGNTPTGATAGASGGTCTIPLL